uniref:Helicase C-terminal domain-containing protein n=1 Tax=Macrostomum lignano TaxID=282301 RepID=A0A1I8FUL5_9PLAT
MNRAVHISRPDMTTEELLITGHRTSKTVRASVGGRIDKEEDMQKIAQACHEYFDSQVSVLMESLEDKSARHLMLITDTDRDLDLLAHVLQRKERPFRVLHGSAYDRDQLSEQFALRKLHEVMMCMRRANGIVVLFKDFELVYGIYNQCRYCRVAMGTQANKNCSVDDKFRCVVLVRADTLERVDRAFLNRFEKQTFGFGDVLSARAVARVEQLRDSFVAKATR